MKNEAERIADQLKRAFDGDAWHGPSLKEAVAGLTCEQAKARPIAGAHSIWELVAHIAAWEHVVTRRLDGESVGEPLEDFPTAPTRASESDWKGLLERVYNGHDRLVAQVAALTEQDLARWIDAKPYPAWFMAHGAVAHVLFHVGQIVLLKRLVV